MTNATITQMDELANQIAGSAPGTRAELTNFPSGAAMLDVHSGDGRLFVMAYSPDQGFGVDEVGEGDGFTNSYRYTFSEFNRAADQLQQMVGESKADGSPCTPIAMNLIVIYSQDIESACRFYSRIGLQFKREKHGNGPDHYAADFGTTVLELYPCRNGRSSSTVRIGLVVPDVVRITNLLRTDGTTIVTEPTDSPWGRRAVVNDPDGNAVELTQKLGIEP